MAAAAAIATATADRHGIRGKKKKKKKKNWAAFLLAVLSGIAAGCALVGLRLFLLQLSSSSSSSLSLSLSSLGPEVLLSAPALALQEHKQQARNSRRNISKSRKQQNNKTIKEYKDGIMAMAMAMNATARVPVSLTAVQRRKSHEREQFLLDKVKQSHELLKSQKRPKQPSEKKTATLRHLEDDDTDYQYHIAFSSGCNALQDWQSYLFFYQIMALAEKSSFVANVTRVASCETEAQAETLHLLFRERIQRHMSSHLFHLHTTPDYSKLRSPHYNFFNKPFGIRHWMQHVLGFPRQASKHDKVIVILMDPDQLLIRPFRRNMTHEPELWVAPNRYQLVDKKQPMAAQYGFGSHWIKNIDITQLLDLNTTTNRNTSGLLTWNQEIVNKHYAVGPPYVAVASDMYDIVDTWCQFVIPIHDQYKDRGPFMAEMYAYASAAAHLNLPHQLVASFMISDPSQNDEAWADWIDSYYYSGSPQNYHNNDNNENLNMTRASQAVCSRDMYPIPHVLHYCQRVYLGNFFFSKYQLPKDEPHDAFFSCQHALFLEPPDTVAALYDWAITLDGTQHSFKKQQQQLRMAFFLCQILPRLNDAATFFKRHHCPKTDATNYNKTFVFETHEAKKKRLQQERHQQRQS